MSFDPLDFAASAGKTIGSMVTGAASGLTSGIGSFISNLSGSGLSLSSLKGLAANKLDAATNFLNGDPSFSRISQMTLATSRSKSAGELFDPAQAIPNSQADTSTKYVRYPTTLSNEFMRVEFSKYDRPGPMKEVKFNTTYTVDLPLPKDLTETHSVRLDPQETGLLTALVTNGGSIVDVAKAAISGNMTGINTTQLADQGMGIMYQGAKQFASGVNVAGISGEQALGMAGQALGAVPNPHISVFFNGVDIRPAMEFSWLLSARNEKESNLIKSIVREFKKKTLPKVTVKDQNIMSYPEMVRLTLYPWGPDFDGTMPTYKMGLINSITVNYSPNGLAFFNDAKSSPVFVVFTFTFQELEVWTATDYGAGNADSPSQSAQSFLQEKGIPIP